MDQKTALQETVQDLRQLWTFDLRRESCGSNGAADAGIVPERVYCEVYETKDIRGQARH